MLAAAALLCAVSASAQALQAPVTRAFTYQGELRSNGAVVVQACDFTFRLYDQAAGGAPLGTQTLANVPVTRGVFNVQLNFGNAFDGDERWLEIDVACPTGSGSFTTLAPRQELTPTPYASYAKNSDTVDGVNAAGFLRSNVNDTFTSGTLSVASGTTLNVDGTLRMDGPVVKTGTGLVTNFNADLLDGLNGASLLRSDTSDTFTSGTLATSGGTILDVNGTLRLDGPVVKTGIGLVTNFNADLLDGLDQQEFLRAAASDTFTLGTLTIAPAATLDVNGTLRMDGSVFKTGTGLVSNFNADLLDSLQGTSFLRSDASDTFTSGTLATSVGTTLDVNGALRMDGTIFTGTDAVVNATNSITFAGSNLNINLGDSSADPTSVLGSLTARSNVFMGIGEGTKQIYFYDTGSATTSSIGWLDPTGAGLNTCTTPQVINSAFVFNITDNTSSGWAFTNGTDTEFVVDDIGRAAIDSTLATGGACDLAESFLGPLNLAPGTVVSIDPARREAVVPSSVPYDPMVVGIVSTRPAILLNGPTAGAYEIWDELEAAQQAVGANPEDAGLIQHRDKLESILDSWERGNVPVALAGRVPTLVNGPVRVGEPLTSSAMPGHAEALQRFGPSIGIAMENHAGGVGKVMVLIQPGWRAPLPAASETEAGASLADASAQEESRGLGRERGRRAVAPYTEGAGGTTVFQGGPLTTHVDPVTGVVSESTVLVAGGAAVPTVRLYKEAWGDYDADGLDDVYVLNPGGGDRLYRNLGDGTFSDVSSTSGLAQTGSRLALWRDFDGDEALDLFLVDARGVPSLYTGSGSGVFRDVTERAALQVAGAVQEAEWLDYDGDEVPDLRVVTASGELFLFHNTGGSFERVELRGAFGAQGATSADAAYIVGLEARLAALEALITERK